jgi:tyrosine-protein kinase Etk/Wzc
MRPAYKATSVLKIDERSDASTIGLGAVGGGGNETGNRGAAQLAGEVELIKSGLTYKKLKQVVPLDVNYYSQGTVLETELFGASPFRVEYTISDPAYYNRKFNVNYVNATTYRLSVTTGSETLGGTYKLGQPVQLPGIQLQLLASTGVGAGASDVAYHFIILDDNTINGYLDKNLTAEVLNASANTLQISFQDYNRQKAQRLVNALDSVYRDAKVARKQESTEKALAYLDQQLRETGNSLAKAEDNLKQFVQLNGTYDAKSELGTITAKITGIDKERADLEQKLTLLNEVARISRQERLTPNDDGTVAQAIPSLAIINDTYISRSPKVSSSVPSASLRPSHSSR